MVLYLNQINQDMETISVAKTLHSQRRIQEPVRHLMMMIIMMNCF